MPKLRSIFIIPLVISAALLMGFAQPPEDELFENGSFETGDFTGWTIVQQQFGNGDWFVYSGTLSPIDEFIILPPPDGMFAAVTDQEEPSSQVLFQDIDIPGTGIVTCSVIVYYINRSEVGFVIGPDLSFLGGSNQQARIDIMDPEAPDFDVDAGVIENLFQTSPGDPQSIGYTTINFDLTDFAETTVRFRAAEVDNEGNFNFSIDDVTCAVERPLANIPTLSEWGFIALALALGVTGLLVYKRRMASV